MRKKAWSLIISFALVISLTGIALASETTGTLQTGIESGIQGVLITNPTASPVAGTYTAAQSVSLAASGSSAICYTTDGSTSPVCASAGTSCTTGTKYSSAISVSSSTTIKAKSCYPTNNSSSIATLAYTISISSGGGGGGGGGTYTVPSLSNIAVYIAADEKSATVSWNTNIIATSRVEYGLDGNFGQNVTSASYTSNHSLVITGLTPKTIYHYILKSVSSDGGMGYTTDKTFITDVKTNITPAPTTGNQTTIAALQAQLAQLQALLLQLLSQQVGTTTGTGTSKFVGIPAGFTFTRNLSLGMIHNDVKYLQILLNSDPDTRVVLTGAGSSGKETTKFGSATKAAVLKFQLKYKITGGTGSVGPSTRAKLNQILQGK